MADYLLLFRHSHLSAQRLFSLASSSYFQCFFASFSLFFFIFSIQYIFPVHTNTCVSAISNGWNNAINFVVKFSLSNLLQCTLLRSNDDEHTSVYVSASLILSFFFVTYMCMNTLWVYRIASHTMWPHWVKPEEFMQVSNVW